MPYIYYPTAPESIGVGRQAREVCYKHDTGADWVAEVDAAFAGETTLTTQAFAAKCAENRAYNDALPPPPEPEAPAATPSSAEKVAAALIASPSLDQATKDALTEALGLAPKFSVVETEGV